MRWMIPLVLALAVPIPAAASSGCGSIERMSPDERLGQLVMVGGAADETRKAVRELKVGLASLPDMPDVRQAAAFSRSLGPGVLVGGDFE